MAIAASVDNFMSVCLVLCLAQCNGCLDFCFIEARGPPVDSGYYGILMSVTTDVHLLSSLLKYLWFVSKPRNCEKKLLNFIVIKQK